MSESKDLTLAPVVLFTYNRPEHTRITLEYLSRCDLAEHTMLYVFCDGPKPDATPEVRRRIDEVKLVLRSRQWVRKAIIESADSNKGLFRNVTEGIEQVIKKHGRCIAIEDDLKIGMNFLRYMNTALDMYASVDCVKQVSGFMFPTTLPRNRSAILLPLSNTIGWATWARAWNEIDFSAAGYEELLRDKKLRRRFNLDNAYDYSKMLVRQMANERYGSWGVLFWWSVFRSEGLVVYPDYSLIQHNDFDHTGVHASDDSHYNHKKWDDRYCIEYFPQSSEGPNYQAFESVCAHLRKRSTLGFRNIVIRAKNLLTNFR